ncbi:MAG: Rieske 2Fe-2S domain-containing protein [Sedimenticola sp.]
MSGTQKLVLANMGDLAEGTSKGFSVELNGERLEGFLVHKNGAVCAYINNCPHTGAPLDWMPDQFLDREGEFIQCAMHGALFEIESGLCVHGPCVNRKLQRLEVEVDGGKVVLGA